MKKNIIYTAMAAAAAAALISGCKGQGALSAPDGSGGETAGKEQSQELSTDAKEGITDLKIHFHGYDRYTLLDKDGELLPVIRLAGEKTNVKIESVANPVSQNSVEEFQLQATEKFPADIYGGTSITVVNK